MCDQVKEGLEDERHLTAGEERSSERHLRAGEERAEARARVMMAASRLQPSGFDLKLNNGDERSTSVNERLISTIEGERLLMLKAGEERLKMSERHQPLESVSLVMRAGERPNAAGERFLGGGERHLKEAFQGERHLKEGRLVGRGEGEADSDRGSSVDTTDDSG